MHFPCGSNGKESTCNAGDADLIPGSRRYPGEENGYPLQYSCLENAHGWRSLGWQESDTTKQLTHMLLHKLLLSNYYNIGHSNIHFSSAQSLSCVQLFETLWTAACQASLSIRNSQGSLKFMSIKSVMPSNHLILCHPLFFLPLIFPSIRVFSNESVFHIR